MAKSIIDRTINFMSKVWSGADPSAVTTPPSKGTDTASRRHFLSLIVITLAIMAAGLYVALTDDGKGPPGVIIFTPTPTATETSR